MSALPILAVSGLCVMLAGCSASQQLQTATDQYVAERRALHSDLSDFSDAWNCRGMSIYEWQRRYDTPAKADAWRVLCAAGDEVPSRVP